MDQLHIKDVHGSERNSLASSHTDNYSTLSESHGLILENLDGTYCRGTSKIFRFSLFIRSAINVKAIKEDNSPAIQQQQDR